MQGAWYIVEVYCFIYFLHVLNVAMKFRDEPVLLALSVCELVLVFLLSWLTFRGKRLASRILAVLIAFNAAYYVWVRIIQNQTFDIYNTYMLLVQVYFFAGAIMLWRIKELPTRFTDPPQEAPPRA